MTRALRRIVTGIVDGRSIVALDGPPQPSMEFAPGVGLYEIWTDGGGALDRTARPQAAPDGVVLSPPFGGVKLRWFSVAPNGAGEEAPETRAFFRDAFRSIGAADEQPDTRRHPGMHLTHTLDFIVVVEGKVRLLLDDDERVLGPGDVVVQRGTNHAWLCEGDTAALLVAVLIDKRFADARPAGAA